MRIASHNNIPLVLVGGILCVLLFACCSLDYGQKLASEDGIPELVFNDANFVRLQDKKKILQVTAGNLEIYKQGDKVYASDVVFAVIDKDGEVSADGHTSLLLADREKEIYSFLRGANITSYANDVLVSAESLRWNNKTEQLTSGRDIPVTIVLGGFKDVEQGAQAPTQISIEGTGFSASGASLQYRFENKIQGTLKIAEDSVIAQDPEKNNAGTGD